MDLIIACKQSNASFIDKTCSSVTETRQESIYVVILLTLFCIYPPFEYILFICTLNLVQMVFKNPMYEILVFLVFYPHDMVLIVWFGVRKETTLPSMKLIPRTSLILGKQLRPWKHLSYINLVRWKLLICSTRQERERWNCKNWKYPHVDAIVNLPPCCNIL